MQQMSHVQQMGGPQAQNQGVYYHHQQYAPALNMAPPSTCHQIPVQNPQQFPQYSGYGQQVPQYEHPVTPNPHVSYQPQNHKTSVSLQPYQPSRAPRTSSNGSTHISHNRQQPKAQANDQAKSQPVDVPMLLIALADEYFAAAHKIGSSVARVMTDNLSAEYQKLIATGLGCLEATFKKMRLTPRLEAKVRLRYAGVLFEETENYMEAETALSQGILLCEQVCTPPGFCLKN